MSETDPLLTYKNTVYPWQCDHMGHMNTQFFAAAFDAAELAFLDKIASLAELEEKGIGWADIKQTLRYQAEVKSGDIITVYSGVVRLGTKSLTVLHSLRRDEVECATSETVTVQFDLSVRQALPILKALRESIASLPVARQTPVELLEPKRLDERDLGSECH